ncbi:PstS family phosphate ABC transporter substrate-binding protein [Oceanibium sediminis]|uniref:PstS family phosphate ABC transporter substrate-binding protein n=1 Tax=Oceanibium sediminis TaxID=2026339 RepID=UPI000DD4D758|nr:substrate-binding domain-containing protein [Oceanibium sediminis]
MTHMTSRLYRSILCAAASLALCAGLAGAQEVRLSSTDGFSDFTGELVSFDGSKYVLRTSMGTLTFPADAVVCKGDGCPEVNEISSRFRIVGAPGMLRFGIPDLLDSYSLTVDTDIARIESDSGEVAFELLTFDGEKIVDVALQEAEPDSAFAALAAGEAALAITPRRIAEEEARALTGGGRAAVENLGLETIAGADALVVLAGAEVPIGAISLDDIARIYSGRITNWSELGGPDLGISAFTREGGSEVLTMLDRLVMRPRGMRIGAQVITVDNNEGVRDAVEQFGSAIGIASFTGREAAMALPVRDVCGTAVAPDTLSLKSGDYPLTVPVYVYTSPDGVPLHARGLLDFAASDLGQQLLSDVGYVNNLPSVDDGITLPDGPYADLVAGAARLTSRFVVEPGQPLSAVDRARLGRLADFVRTGQAEGQEIILAGLADGTGAPEAARSVLSELFRANPDVEEQLTVAFRAVGAPDPVLAACPAAGPARGNKVEVWIRPLDAG